MSRAWPTSFCKSLNRTVVFGLNLVVVVAPLRFAIWFWMDMWWAMGRVGRLLSYSWGASLSAYLMKIFIWSWPQLLPLWEIVRTMLLPQSKPSLKLGPGPAVRCNTSNHYVMSVSGCPATSACQGWCILPLWNVAARTASAGFET